MLLMFAALVRGLVFSPAPVARNEGCAEDLGGWSGAARHARLQRLPRAPSNAITDSPKLRRTSYPARPSRIRFSWSVESSTSEGLLISEVAARESRPGHIVLRASKMLASEDWMGRDYQPSVSGSAGDVALSGGHPSRHCHYRRGRPPHTSRTASVPGDPVASGEVGTDLRYSVFVLTTRLGVSFDWSRGPTGGQVPYSYALRPLRELRELAACDIMICPVRGGSRPSVSRSCAEASFRCGSFHRLQPH